MTVTYGGIPKPLGGPGSAKAFLDRHPEAERIGLESTLRAGLASRAAAAVTSRPAHAEEDEYWQPPQH